MTSSPPVDGPEFRGKTLTPVSPRPLHLPEPSNIPVLQNQMDPVFNSTSTHLDFGNTIGPAELSNFFNSEALPDDGGSSLTFEALAEHDLGGGNILHGDGDLNDDYAMSLDFDDDGMEEPGATVTESEALAANESAHPQPSITADAMSDANHLASASLAEASNATTTTSLPEYSSLPADPTSTSTAPSLEPINLPEQAADLPSAEDDRNNVHTLKEEPAEKHGEEVNIQALLDNLSPSIATAPASEANLSTATEIPAISAPVLKPETAKSPSSGLPPHPNLPPRPPPQANSAAQSSYTSQNDLRLYLSSQAPVGAPSFAAQPPGAFRPAQNGLPAVVAAGAPGTATQPASSLPPPPVATFQQAPPAGVTQQSSPDTPTHRQREKAEGTSVEDDEEIPWTAELQKVYDEFLHDERVYVSEAQWDRFPPNSRLFIGNLPTEKVHKRDLFYIFHKHGRLAQVSIKQAYGFVQFLDADACYRALQAEQGSSVRGRKMHLEISKPQKSGRGGGGDQGGRSAANRRSRSPDYTRGAPSPRGANFGRGGDRVDRGVDNRRQGRDRAFPERRARDDYRPGRSPSPRGYRGGDDYRRGGRDRSRDRFDGRRSRSRSPYRRGSRYHSRSPPPRRWDGDDELDIPLPKRYGQAVPEVQIIVIDDLDRAFISYVEKAFRDRGIRTDVLMLSPRLSLGAVIKRQILEGVQAVSRLTRQSQMTLKVPLQVFDRTSGTDNVRFDEYDNLDPAIAAELVLRARQTHAAVPRNQYGAAAQTYAAPQYGQPLISPVQPQVAAPNPATANITNLISSLDPSALQKLLGALQQPPQTPQQPLHLPQQHQAQVPPPPPPQQQPQPAAPTSLTDLASLLGGAVAARPIQQAPYQQPAPPPQQPNPYAALASSPAFASNPALAALLASTTNRAQQPSVQTPQQHHQPPVAATPQVQNIMDQLAKWKQ